MRLLGASVQGRSHIITGTRCQDACQFEVIGNTALIAVSDGAGSAKLSHLGSSIIVQSLIDYIKTYKNQDEISKKDINDSLDYVYSQVEADSAERGVDVKEYSSTAIIVVSSRDRTVYAQVGDGAIVGRLRDDDKLQALTWPQQGEYANSTHFLGPDRGNRIIDKTSGLTELAAFTDGLQNVALSFSTKTPHLPFLNPFFLALKAANADLDVLTKHLNYYLTSNPQLGNRTDDDLSLVIGVRE